MCRWMCRTASCSRGSRRRRISSPRWHRARQGRGYLLPNLLETHDVLWAASSRPSPASIYSSRRAIAGILTPQGRVLVAYSGDDFPYLAEIGRRSARWRPDFAPFCESPGEERPPRARFRRRARQAAARPLLSAGGFAKGDIATYFHTGGTTGVPKITPSPISNETVCAYTHTLCSASRRATRFSAQCRCFTAVA